MVLRQYYIINLENNDFFTIAFDSIISIIVNINNGWFIRILHVIGASLFCMSFTLHYSILFLIIPTSLSLIYCYFRCYIKFSLYVLILYLLWINVKLTIHLSLLILSSFFSNFTFFIPIFLDFFIILFFDNSFFFICSNPLVLFQSPHHS